MEEKCLYFFCVICLQKNNQNERFESSFLLTDPEETTGPWNMPFACHRYGPGSISGVSMKYASIRWFLRVHRLPRPLKNTKRQHPHLERVGRSYDNFVKSKQNNEDPCYNYNICSLRIGIKKILPL